MGIISDLGNYATSEGRDIAQTTQDAGPAAGVGRATRTILGAPAVAMGSAANDVIDKTKALATPVASTIANFARGFSGDTAAAPAAPPATTAVDPVQLEIMKSIRDNPPPPAAAAPPAVSTPAPVAEGTAQPQAKVQDAADETRPSNVRAIIRRPTAAPTGPATTAPPMARNVARGSAPHLA